MTPTSAEPPKLRFGANYVPSQGWFNSWLDLDPASVARDLDDIASLGMDHIRIFPVWPWIQPARTHLRDSAIRDVRTVVGLAADRGLRVAVDLIQGHLSSFDFVPSWMVTWHQASLFTDPRVRSGLHTYVTAMCEALAGEPDVFAITLGNEVNNLWPANPTTIADSTHWASDLVALIRSNARPDQRVVHSLFDDAFYAPDHPFSAADVVRLGDESSVHSWVFNGTSRIDGPLGPATVSHAAYLASLAAAFGGDDRPVWLQEVGAPQPDVPPDVAVEFVERTVQAVGAVPQLSGITWWCSHDIDRRQVDFPEREYDLGLFTVDHVAKPAARALSSAVAELRRADPQRDDRAGAPDELAAPADIVSHPELRGMVAPGSGFHREWVQRSTQPDGTLLPVRITPPGKRS